MPTKSKNAEPEAKAAGKPDNPGKPETAGKPENPGGTHEGAGPGGRRVDPPGQDGNENSHRPETPPGKLSGSVSGTDENDALTGGRKADSLAGGGGDDTITGGRGEDSLEGGDGGDVFNVGSSAKRGDDFDRVFDFTHGEDKLEFGLDGGDESNYRERTATDYDDAFAQAQALIRNGELYVSVQVGDDVIVFAGQANGDDIGTAVVLVGRTLADISAGDII